MSRNGPPPSAPASKATKAGWMDGYGDRPPFDPTVDPTDPEYVAARARGMRAKQSTEKRLRKAGLR